MGIYAPKADCVTIENGKRLKSYATWHKMFKRCSEGRAESVDIFWHSFKNFKEWYDEMYVEGYQLDKDILCAGNKVYSKDKCCMVPQWLNGYIKGTTFKGYSKTSDGWGYRAWSIFEGKKYEVTVKTEADAIKARIELRNKTNKMAIIKAEKYGLNKNIIESIR